MERLLAALRAAGEPTRLRILAVCATGELSVSDLTLILGQSQPRVSRHLKLLCDAGLLDRHREGTFAYFRLTGRPPFGELARSLVDLVPADDAAFALDRERLEAIKSERAAAAAAYFRDNAGRWDEIRALHIADSEVEDALLRLLDEELLGDLVDLGTGSGRMLTLLGHRARHAVGVDLSREMLAVARANLDKAGLRHGQVRLGDLYQLPLPSAAFDVAIMHQVLHYLESPGDALAEAARVLRPDGRLLIADFARHEVESLRAEHAHRWLGFDDDRVQGWLEQAGFAPGPSERLPGSPLTVVLWPGRRLALPATAVPHRPAGRGDQAHKLLSARPVSAR